MATLRHLGLNPTSRSIAILLAALVAAWSVPVRAGDFGATALGPVTVIDREDIALSGLRTLLELLELRGPTNHFGLGRLLVADRSRMVLLIDGRRAGPIPDLDTIPLSMVERIEILDDSAVGPLAGHATSGAVNVVLREDLEGIEAQAGVIQPSEEGAQSPSGSVLWRGPVGRGRLTLGVDSLRRNEIRLADRDYGRSSWREGGSFAEAIGVSPSGNTAIVNRDRLRPTETEKTQRYRSIGDCRTENGYTGTLGNPFGSTGEGDTGCGFASGNRNWLTVRYHQTGLLGAFSHPVGSDAEAFSEVRLMPESDAIARLAPSSGRFEITPSDPADFGGTSDDMFRVAHTFAAHGDRELRHDGREYRLLSGLRGQTAAGLGYEAHVSAYRHEFDRTMGSLVSRSAIQAAIASGAYDLENPLSAPMEVIRGTSLRLHREYGIDYKEFRLALNGAGIALGGGMSRWLAGAELATQERHNRVDYRDRTGRSYPADDILGKRASDSTEFHGDRRRVSPFAELSLPLSADWDVALAGRADEYDDVGAATSYRVATRYRLNHRLALRSAFGAGARPPGLAALNREASESTAWICDSRSHGDSEEPCTLRKVAHELVANPALEPERSGHLSIGASLTIAGMSLSADWFRMTLSRIPLAYSGSAQAIMDLEGVGALPEGVGVTRDSHGNSVSVRSSYGNTGREEISGLDIALHGAWQTGRTDLGLELHWLHRADYKAWDAGAQLPGHLPRNSAHAMLRAGRGDITANWSVHARSGYANAMETGRFGSWIGHDLALEVRNPFGFTGASLSAGVLNVGNAEPSADSANPNSFEPHFDGLRGRTLFLTAKAAF